MSSTGAHAIAELALAVKSAKNILVLVGAGISVNAGIPDFRSPQYGVYSTGIDAEDVFHIDSFCDDPIPFYRLVSEWASGVMNAVPTKSHWFLKTLKDANKLRRIYTQNIDGLDTEGLGLRSGVDVIQCHGHLRDIACSQCGKRASDVSFIHWVDRVREYLSSSAVGALPAMNDTVLRCPKCAGFTKPAVVLFGESLPPSAFRSIESDASSCDLLLVVGTSLTVFPFAAIPSMVGAAVPRFLIAKSIFKALPDDITVITGDCDTILTQVGDTVFDSSGIS